MSRPVPRGATIEFSPRNTRLLMDHTAKKTKTKTIHTNNSIDARQASRVVVIPGLASLLVLIFPPFARVPTWRVHVLVENVICIAQPRPFVSGRGTAHPRKPDAFITQPIDPRFRDPQGSATLARSDPRFTQLNDNRASNQGKQRAIAKR